ncbi:MAG: hypothetical protein J0L72_09875 [Armatimonadetes bacterium]|nr:hypothetical protein [Armatimonadota bacterium]
MDDKQKRFAIIALVLVLLAGGITAFTQSSGVGKSGEGMINQKNPPPPDSAPLPADQGGSGVPPAGSTPEGRGT